MKVETLKDGLSWSTKEQKEVDAKELVARAVYDPNPESENGRFFTATPSATLTLNAVNKEALGDIKVGDEIYVTIELANKV